jgi:hypothetical protein
MADATPSDPAGALAVAPEASTAPDSANSHALTASMKRKREDDDEAKDSGEANGHSATTNGTIFHEDTNGVADSPPTESEMATIRNYLTVLEQ